MGREGKVARAGEEALMSLYAFCFKNKNPVNLEPHADYSSGAQPWACGVPGRWAQVAGRRRGAGW